MNIKYTHGFTFLELLIVLAIAAIVTTVAVPGFKTAIDNSELTSTTNELIGTLNYARIEAIKRGQPVVLSSSSSTDWSNKNRVWLDNNADNTFNSNDTEIRIMRASNKNILLQTNGYDDVTFLASGFVNSAVTFTICHNDTSIVGRQISLMISGRINVDSDYNCAQDS
ncbi:MAG: GspH/FimT family pseudopilin [Pseudomonadota bacterium]